MHPHAAGARRTLPQTDTPVITEQATQAVGSSRGGKTTKIHVVCDLGCRPLAIVLSGGQRGDSVRLTTVLDAVRLPRIGQGRPRRRPYQVVADRAYSSRKSRRALRARRITLHSPEKCNSQRRRQRAGADGGRPPTCAPSVYRKRNVIERCFRRLQNWRRVATRYEKKAENYLAMVTLASILLWLR